MLPLLPADATTTTPRCTALMEAPTRSSSICPYGDPSDMLTTSTASEMSPSPFGSRAKSIPSSSATPLQEVDTELQTFTAYSVASGATPLLPAMIEATWVPCPPAQGAGIADGPQSIGSGSGARGP